MRKPAPSGLLDMHPAGGGGESPREPEACANLPRLRSWRLHQGRGRLGPAHPRGPRHDIPPQSSPAPWGYSWGGCPDQHCSPQQGEGRVACWARHLRGRLHPPASGTDRAQKFIEGGRVGARAWALPDLARSGWLSTAGPEPTAGMTQRHT